MRLGVNALFIRPARVGGAESMAYNLVAALAVTMGPDDSLLVLATDEARDVWPLVDGLGDRVSFAACGPGGESNRLLLETRKTHAYTNDVDVWLHSNYYTPPRLSKPSVTVVHDEQFRDLPELFSRKKRAWLELAHRYTAHAAADVVFISHSAAEHARARGRAHPTVIENPISWARLETSADAAPAGAPSVLAVAAHYPHKRTELLLRAWQLVEASAPEATLELVGQSSSQLVSTQAVPLEQLADELGLRNVNFRGHVTDRELARYYAAATLFVAPSRYEGFGMPVVEALGTGLPVVATDLPVFREVAPVGVTYVPVSGGPTEWAAAITAGLGAPRLGAQDIAWYRERYSPDRIGGLYWAAARSVAG